VEAVRHPDPQRAVRSSAHWIALIVVLIAGFGSAFALAHSTSDRTVKDPPHVVTVTADAKVMGATAASLRSSTPGNLEKLVATGGISGLAPLPTTHTHTQTSTQTATQTTTQATTMVTVH
jgi:hypothetical protein